MGKYKLNKDNKYKGFFDIEKEKKMAEVFMHRCKISFFSFVLALIMILLWDLDMMVMYI